MHRHGFWFFCLALGALGVLSLECGFGTSPPINGGTIAFAASACSDFDAASTVAASPPTGTPADDTDFSNTLFAAITTAPLNCSMCHNGTDADAPPFATTPSAALPVILRYITWDNPNTSLIVNYAGNGHCGEPNCASNSAPVLTALQAWISQEDGNTSTTASPCTPPVLVPTLVSIGGYPVTVTPEQPYPDFTSADGGASAFATMSFPLDSDGIVGAIFSIDVQLYVPGSSSGPAYYRFKEPRLTSPNSTPISIGEIHLFVNGTEPPGFGDYYPIQSTVFEDRPVEISPVWSTSVVQENTSGADQIQFGFKVLQTTSMPSCNNLSGFETNIIGPSADAGAGTINGTCITCHGSSNATYPQAYTAFPMDPTNPATLCAMAKARTMPNVQWAANSALIVNPNAGNNGDHPLPDGGSLISNTYNQFVNWIASEAPDAGPQDSGAPDAGSPDGG